MDLGRNPVSKHQIQPEYGDEQADARDCPTRLARPNSQGREQTNNCVQIFLKTVVYITQISEFPT